jgi:lactoylglutathione lyase
MSARLNLIVLRSPQLEAVKSFYEAIGLAFVPEKHGRGPDHFSSTSGTVVLELYPSGKEADVSDLRLGFDVRSLPEIIARLIGLGVDVPDPEGQSVVVNDPDGRRVELTQERP